MATDSGNHIGFGERGEDLQPLGGAEDRDGGRDDTVAVEQRRTEDAEQHEHRLHHVWAVARVRSRQQGDERQNAAFALVVGA
jgi:hypothetical protein